MGDANILIRVEQYDKMVPIMESVGFTAVLESDHEPIWKFVAFYLELHKCLIPTYNKDYYAYFGNGWKLTKVRQSGHNSMMAEDTCLLTLLSTIGTAVLAAAI